MRVRTRWVHLSSPRSSFFSVNRLPTFSHLAFLLLFGLLVGTPAGCTSPGAAAQSGARPPTLDVQRLEREVHTLVNRTRRDHGLSPVGWRRSLRSLAIVHSQDMAEHRFFAHRNPDNEFVNERAERLGVECQRPLRSDGTRVVGLAENLSRSTRYGRYRDVYVGDERVRREYEWQSAASIARATVQGWLDSPPHRRNLLSPHVGDEGIGIVVTDEYVYVTQVFC
jgi:uncharacterized protein YkwD